MIRTSYFIRFSKRSTSQTVLCLKPNHPRTPSHRRAFYGQEIWLRKGCDGGWVMGSQLGFSKMLGYHLTVARFPLLNLILVRMQL